MTPTHYQTGDRPHAMDIIESFLADDTLSALEGFFLGNALKYLYRFNHKGDRDGDLCKAMDYIEMLLDERKEQTADGITARRCTRDDVDDQQRER